MANNDTPQNIIKILRLSKMGVGCSSDQSSASTGNNTRQYFC